MFLVTKANIFASKLFWEKLSSDNQKRFCSLLASIYQTRLSALFIPAFCRRYKIDSDTLGLYLPASGESKFKSFQDFFSRKLGKPLEVNSDYVWPCEGYVCESGIIQKFGNVNVKGNLINVKEIFGELKTRIKDQDFFANIFLHNHNYHRFHSPTNAKIKNILHIPGQLLFLRPWFYNRSRVSFPSFLNERVVVELEDNNDKTWLLCFVAGMGVGNIKLHENIKLGNTIKAGEEIGLFLLGSTCCLISPYQILQMKYMEQVKVGSDVKFTE